VPIAATICSDVACFSDAALFGTAELSPRNGVHLMMSVTGLRLCLSLVVRDTALPSARSGVGGGELQGSGDLGARRPHRIGGLAVRELVSVDFLSADLLSAIWRELRR